MKTSGSHDSQPWWQVFFGHADSLILSNFPSRRETREEITGLRRLLRLGRSDLIADVCCGMGRHLLPLTAAGYSLVGVDTSPLMLELASRGAQAAKLQVSLVRGAAQDLPLQAGRFDVVLNLFNSFGYLATAEEDFRVLTEAARCLKPGGRFFLDTRNKKYQILYAPYNQPLTLADGREMVLRCTYHRDTQRLDSCWYDADDQSRLIQRASIRLYSPTELREMLTKAGFRIQKICGNYGGDEFEGWERQLLFVCERV